MSEIAESGDTLFLRWDRLRSLLADKLGPKATRPDMARYLGIRYMTLWRITSVKNGRRHPCNPDTVTAIRAKFPDAPNEELFDFVDQPRHNGQPVPPLPQIEQFFTVAQIAQQLNCSPDHIYRLIARNQIAWMDIGIGKPKIRIAASALAVYREKNERGPGASKKADGATGGSRRTPVAAGRAA